MTLLHSSWWQKPKNKTFLNASPQIGNRLNNRDQQALRAATGRAVMGHGPPANLGFVEHIFWFRLSVMRMLGKSNSGTLSMTNPILRECRWAVGRRGRWWCVTFSWWTHPAGLGRYQWSQLSPPQTQRSYWFPLEIEEEEDSVSAALPVLIYHHIKIFCVLSRREVFEQVWAKGSWCLIKYRRLNHVGRFLLWAGKPYFHRILNLVSWVFWKCLRLQVH